MDLIYQEEPPFNGEDFLSCEVGNKWINPRNIISLSRPYEDLMKDGYLLDLEMRIKNEGWKDTDGIHLVHWTVDTYIGKY
jgi:hypothetical protein